AHEAAGAAARLLGLRYEEGMATLADLLQAQSQAAGFEARLVEAEARWRMALSRLDFVLGTAPDTPIDERTDSPQGEER
ncbi:MAG: TolC family protein, partial [Gemmatimonadetes bacterium]|nr:TolC family protein [Gemmatimonadota bacterium]